MSPEQKERWRAGLEIWKRRMRLGLTHAELADRCQETPFTIMDIERGTRKVSRLAYDAVESALQAAEEAAACAQAAPAVSPKVNNNEAGPG